jgi:hypothetical protein
MGPPIVAGHFLNTQKLNNKNGSSRSASAKRQDWGEDPFLDQHVL